MIDKNKVYNLRHCTDEVIEKFKKLINIDGCTPGCKFTDALRSNYVEFNGLGYPNVWSMSSSKPFDKEIVEYKGINPNRID